MRIPPRTIMGLLGVLMLTVAMPGIAHQQDMTGTWLLSVELDVGAGTATLVLTQEGNEITGTYSGALGEDLPLGGEVTAEGITISFDSEAGKVTYVGKVEEGVFEGTCEYGQLGNGTFKGTKPKLSREEAVHASGAPLGTHTPAASSAARIRS